MGKIKSIITILLFLISIESFSQTDKNGNPIFNSLKIESIVYENIEIISNYYTIENNIDNKSSSVFIQENPTSEDYINFSTKLPSYFFIIVDKGNVLGMAMLIPKAEDDSFFYNVVIPDKYLNFQIPSQLKGKITEHRINEILNLKKIKAEINKNVFKFNNKNFEILQYNQIIEEFKKRVFAEIIAKKGTEISDIDQYIKAESKDGGKLDFKNQVEKYESAFIAFDGIMYSKKDFTILMWGASVKKIGIKDFSRAQNIWEQINNKKLTEPELKALKKGFETKFE